MAQERTVAVSASTDGGKRWAEQPTLALRNPDAAVAALSVAPGFIVMAHNPQPQGRSGLHISSSADGRNWLLLATPVQGDAAAEYSYPALAWADGSLWLSYTDMRRQIAWQQYSLGPGGR
jgi:predicted neuraminidase